MDLDDRVLQRWVSLEMGRVAEGLVRTPGWLLELLRAPTPSARTRGGQTHFFDRAALARLADSLSPVARADARVPFLLYLDRELPANATPWTPPRSGAYGNCGPKEPFRARDGSG